MKSYIRSWLSKRIQFARREDINNLYKQISSFIDLKDIIGPNVPMGPLRGWALSPDALLIVLRDITERPSPRVVEFGSGESTIAIAAALKRRGDGTLTSFEHNEKFSRNIAERLRRADLASHVDLRVIPLRHYKGTASVPSFDSYDLSDQDIEFDVAIVDGPINILGSVTRSVPLEWAVSRLRRNGTIYLDDASREGERAAVEGLRAKWQGVVEEWLDCEKGLLRLRLG